MAKAFSVADFRLFGSKLKDGGLGEVMDDDSWKIVWPSDDTPEDQKASFEDKLGCFANITSHSLRCAIDQKKGEKRGSAGRNAIAKKRGQRAVIQNVR